MIYIASAKRASYNLYHRGYGKFIPVALYLFQSEATLLAPAKYIASL